MPSIRGRSVLLQPLVDVQVAPAVGGGGSMGAHYVGLIDTGCTRTCVTRRVVDNLSLEVVARLLVSSPTEIQRRKAYEFRLGFYSETASGSRTLYMLPDPIVGPDFVDNPNFDVLIGMDVISRGRLAIERGGDFVLEV